MASTNETTLWDWNEHTATLNLTFIRRNTRFFTFVYFADIFLGRRS